MGTSVAGATWLRARGDVPPTPLGTKGFTVASPVAGRFGAQRAVAIQSRLVVMTRQHRGPWFLAGTVLAALWALGPGAQAAESQVRVDSVQFGSGNAVLRGVIYLPASRPPYPAVFFLHGGGTQSLNSEPADFARMLVARGIAALVYDKRGTGSSAGDYATATFDDFIADGEAAYRYLAGRSDILASRVGVIGFSQGGRFAPIVATTQPLAAAISVSGPAVPPAAQRLFALRNSMLERGVSPEWVERAIRVWRMQFEAIERGAPLAPLDAVIAAAAAEIPRGLLPPPASQYAPNPILNSFGFRGDSVLDNLRAPFLALLGSADVIVPVEPTVANLRARLGADRPGRLEIVVLEDATHALDLPPGTRHPAYVARVMDWMERHLKTP